MAKCNPNSGGKAAANIGPEYQNRCYAWYAVQILAEAEGISPPGIPADSICKFVICESDQPTDDLLVGYSPDRNSFEQAKHSINLSEKDDSLFASVIDQFVRQFVHGQVQNPESIRPWDRKLDPDNDRFVLLSQNATKPIAEHLYSVLDNVRNLIDGQSTEDAATTIEQKRVFDVTVSHIEKKWKIASNEPITPRNIRIILKMMHVRILTVDEGRQHEEQAISLLKTSVLRDPNQAESCWKVLIQHGFALARKAGGGTLQNIQIFLAQEHGFKLKGPASFKSDIGKLRKQTAEAIRDLKQFSEIKPTPTSAATKVPRIANAKLIAQIQQGSLIVVGEPGAGKSGSLYETLLVLLSQTDDVIAFIVGRLASKSLGNLRGEIGLEHDLIDVIRNWPTSAKGFLVIDAMDAARGEQSEQMLRELIIRVGDHCPNWHLLVSIRKYELRYNIEMQRIFAGEADGEFFDPEFKKVRHVNIGPLTDEELEQVTTSVPELHGLISEKSAPLYDLIRVPFNLKLMVEMIFEGVEVRETSTISSQVELLDRYWVQRVIKCTGGDARETVLARIVESMLENRTLVVSKMQICAGHPASVTPMIELLSSQVLKEWQQSHASKAVRYRIEFGHHVIFDFAVERLVIRSDPDFISTKISNEPDLLFAIRPSIDVHFRFLWTQDEPRFFFWDEVFRVCQNDDALTIVKLIGPSVAAKLANSMSDVQVLADRLNDSTNGPQQKVAIDVFAHLCNALMAQSGDASDKCGLNASPWVELIEGVCK